ncbi:MAG: hypothetical protein EOP06_04825, partial [Proteobacteria bacterium]
MSFAARQVVLGLVHHSDRGSQYDSKAYQRRLSGCRMRESMRRKGDCWDNAPIERAFSICVILEMSMLRTLK